MTQGTRIGPGGRSPPARTLAAAVTLTALLCVTGAGLAASQSERPDVPLTADRKAPKCDGERATVKGSRGTPRDDVIVGTREADRISGKAGDDLICGKGDRDKVKAGAGNDTVHAGGGSDGVGGGPGDDFLSGDGGNDKIDGGPGTDDCDGGPGRNQLIGCEGPSSPPPTEPPGPEPDRPPSAVADSATVDEDSPEVVLAVLDNDTDLDGGPRAIAAVGDPANGTTRITDGGGALAYTPRADFCNSPGGTPDAFDYTLDGGSSATVSVTVTCASDPPTDIALSGTRVNPADPPNTAVGALTAADVDAGDTHAFALVAGTGDANNASFMIDGSTLRTAAPLAAGSYSIRIRATDTTGGSVERQFTILSTSAPTDIALSNATIAENEPGDTEVGLLSTTDNPGDTHTYALVGGVGDDDNGSFTIVDDSLRTAGPLDFEATPTLFVRVRTTDADGGTFEKQFTITVADENEPPTEIALSPSSVAENEAAATLVGDLTSTDEDAGDSHAYDLVAGSGDADNADFQISGSQLLTAASLDFESGATRSVRVRSTDGGGAMFEKELTITVTDRNDAPVADDESFSGVERAVGNTALTVDAPGDGATDPPGPQKAVDGDILAGDTDDDGEGSLAVEAGTFATNDGGSVELQADGDFTFLPATGTSCFDTSDFFEYTVTDQNSAKPPGAPATDVGRVTIAIADCVWYVDPAAGGGGSGRSDAPLDTLGPLDGFGGAGDADGTGQRIFLYPGTLSGGLPLESSQRLLSQRHGLTVPDGGGGNLVLEPAVPAGPNSQLDGGLVLAANNTVQGLHLGTTGSGAVFALSGTSVGQAVINTETSGAIDNPAGGAVRINGSANVLDMHFTGVTSAGSTTNAIALASASGAFTVDGASPGSLTGATGADVALAGGSVDFRYDGQIADDTGQLVSISDQTGGTKDFNGQVTDAPADGDGGGVSLFGNAGATVRFDGGLALSTGSSAGLSAVGGGTLAVPDPAGAAVNSIASTTGTALNVSGPSIHSDDLVFERIGSNDATSGIVLSNTGSAGGLTVTGTGNPDSGGTIDQSNGAGIALTNVGGGVDLSRMRVEDGADDGIRGTNVTDFRLADSAVVNNGDAVGENGLDFSGLSGTVALPSDTVTGSAENNVSIVHESGALNATVTGGTYGSTSTSIGDDGIKFAGNGTGSMTASIQGATFTNNRGDHVQMTTDASNTVTQDLTVTGSTMSTTAGADPTVLGGGITFNPGGNATADLTIVNNTIQEAFSSAITVDTPGSAVDPQPATIDATISGNTIGTAGAVDSGSESGDGISVFSNGLGDVDALIDSNVIRQYSNLAGINLVQNDGNGTLDVTARNNLIANPGSFATNGILVRSGLTGGTETGTTCLDLGHPSTAAQKNSISGSAPAGGSDIRVRHLAQTTVRLAGYGGSPFDTSAVVAYLQGRNNGDGTPDTTATTSLAGGGFTNIGACTQP